MKVNSNNNNYYYYNYVVQDFYIDEVILDDRNNGIDFYFVPFFHQLTRSLRGQFFPGCHPRVGFSFAEVPAGGAGVRLRYIGERVYSSVALTDAH